MRDLGPSDLILGDLDPGRDDLAAAADVPATPPDAASADLSTAPDSSTSADLSPHDLHGIVDMAVASDLRRPPDLGEPADLTRPPPDLTGIPSVTGVPVCSNVNVTASTLYANVAASRCGRSSCHGHGGKGSFEFTDASSLRAALVDVPAAETAEVERVQPGNLDRSYVMYKLMGQQAKVGGSGSAMPTGDALTTLELCQFILWIRQGAR